MKNKHGFSLIEILIVVVVVGLMATSIARLSMQKRDDDWNYVLESFNLIAAIARNESILHHQTHRIIFSYGDARRNMIHVEEEIDNPQKVGSKMYRASRSRFQEQKYELPVSIKIKSVIVNDKEQMGGRTNTAPLYISHEGIFQPATIQLIRKKDGQETIARFGIEPFIGIFELKEGASR